jgi:Domain of unknown function (DUF4276)
MIKPIVEGHGEVPALPILLRKIAGERFGIWNPPLLTPGRYPASQLLRCEDNVWVPGPGLIKAAGHARNEGATALLVLLDADDFCANSASASVRPALADATGFDLAHIVFAVREYEAWLLASAETLQDRALAYPHDPEQPRDAKGALERHLGLLFPYNARTEQPAFSAKINVMLCHERSRSFRKLTKDFKELLAACGMNPIEDRTS